MKKIIIVVLILLVIPFLGKNNNYITDDMIRFRVIANSNSSKDVIMKMKIVSELSKVIFNDNNTIEDARKDVINNLENVNDIVNKTFKENNYEENYNISYGLNYFPEKEYNGQIFEEGYYESLVIEIGEGKGNNYWCILYPPLCMIDEEYDERNIEYDFKLLKILKNIF